MGSSAKLRQGVCIFTLLGLLSAPYAGFSSARAEGEIESGDASNVAMFQKEKVVTFRITHNLLVALNVDETQSATLQIGDIVDAAFEMSLDKDHSLFREDIGEENFIKSLLQSAHKNGLLELKVKESKNPALVNKLIFMRPWALKFADLVYDPRVGVVTVDPAGPSDVDADDDGSVSVGNNEPETIEAPDIPLKPVAPSHPPRAAAPRADLPTLRPGEPNLTQTINQAFADYATSAKVNRMVIAANAHVWTVNQHGRKSLTYVVMERKVVRRRVHYVRVTRCWRAVKDALISSGMVDSSFGDNAHDAYMARGVLLNEGFRDLLADPRTSSVMRNPDMAPKGAILVYEDVVRGRVLHSDNSPGHAEIKTTPSGIGGYISINAQTRPAYGKFATGQRRLIAVMVRD